MRIGNKEVQEVEHFKYLGRVLTRDGYYTMEIKMRAAIRKIITIDKQDKPSTQKELGDVLSSEDRFTWLRDLEITKIGAEVFREF